MISVPRVTAHAPDKLKDFAQRVDASLRVVETELRKRITPRVVSGDAILFPVDEVVLVDTTGGAVGVTLPDAHASLGLVLRVKNIGAGGAATLTAAGTDTIEGAATLVLASAYDQATLTPHLGVWYRFP